MSQTDLLKFFYFRYVENKNVYYSVADIAHEFNMEKSAVNRQLVKLWLTGALVCKSYERIKNGISMYNWGKYYRLNDVCVNRVRIMIEIEQKATKKSDDSIQRNTYIPNIVLEKEKKSHKGVI